MTYPPPVRPREVRTMDDTCYVCDEPFTENNPPKNVWVGVAVHNGACAIRYVTTHH